MTRFLEDQGYIDRVPRPGERKDYFALRPGVATSLLEGAQKSIGKLRAFRASARHQWQEGPVCALAEAIELFAFWADS
jgi:hypothetical protein